MPTIKSASEGGGRVRRVVNCVFMCALNECDNKQLLHLHPLFIMKLSTTPP